MTTGIKTESKAQWTKPHTISAARTCAFNEKRHYTVRGIVWGALKLTWCCAVWLFCVSLLSGYDAAQAKEFLRSYCLECHSGKKVSGDTDLGRFTFSSTDALATWQGIRNAIYEQYMPPAEQAKQPAESEANELVTWMSDHIDGRDDSHASNPGYVLIRRLTKREYSRTLRDLIGAHVDWGDRLPNENVGEFDTHSASQVVSADYAERVTEVAIAALEQASSEACGFIAPKSEKPADERTAAEKTLTAFLPRAWRRPVSKLEIATCLRAFDLNRKRKGADYASALKATFAYVLSSPKFLFRPEQRKPGQASHPLGAYELANRLSYFLWSSMPDEQLFNVAASGDLLKDDKYLQQVDRMLGDARFNELPRYFIGQWLGTAELADGEGPDPTLINGYTPALRTAMIQEPGELFASLVRENDSLLALIDGDFVVVNGELARHYDLKGDVGASFKRLAVSAESPRGGLIAMAAVMAITSVPARSSPTLRGKWVLDKLLSLPPPPPPPNTPQLPEAEVQKSQVSLREQLERHRSDPECRACHQRIDPLGFALENFGPLGTWRTRDANGQPIDSSASLPNGRQLHGVQDLKLYLFERKDRIIHTIVTKLLSYALGRPVTVDDRSTVIDICRKISENKYGARTLVREICLSLPFRSIRGQSPVSSTNPKP